MEYLFRFLVGGFVVSFFAILGSMLKPKSFAGLFDAAPSVALATISLTLMKDGSHYAALEARSMIIGAIAFAIYAYLTSKLLLTGKWSALCVTSALLSIWLPAALLGWYVFLG